MVDIRKYKKYIGNLQKVILRVIEVTGEPTGYWLEDLYLTLLQSFKTVNYKIDIFVSLKIENYKTTQQ